MTRGFANLYLSFLFMSFIGYIVEVLLCSITQHKWVNRGFLFGPIIPIWGVGGLLITSLLYGYKENPILVFVLAMLIAGVVEYYTSYLFEKIFNNKWWDYSYKKDNINGRICISNLVWFAIGGTSYIYIMMPVMNNLLDKIPFVLQNVIAIILFILLIADLIASSVIAYNLRSKLIVAEELKKEKIKLLPSLLEKKYRDQIVKIKFRTNRLIKNYPTLSKGLNNELNFISKVIDKYGRNKRKK